MTPLPLCSMAKGKKATDTARNYLYAEVLAVKIPIKLNNLFQTFRLFKCVYLIYPMILKSKKVHGLTVTGPNPWNSKVPHFSFNFPISFRTWKRVKRFRRARQVDSGVVDLGLVKSFMLDWISDQIRFCNCGSSEESFVGNAWLKPMSAKMLIRNFSWSSYFQESQETEHKDRHCACAVMVTWEECTSFFISRLGNFSLTVYSQQFFIIVFNRMS